MCSPEDIDAKTLPVEKETPLSEAQAKIERTSLGRVDQNARNLPLANIALLASLTVVYGFVEPPYFWRFFLWTALGLCVTSSIFCAFTIHLSDRMLNSVDLSGKKQDRTAVNRNDFWSLTLFSFAFVSLAVFVAANLAEALRNDRIIVDISASKYRVSPGEIVQFEVAGVEGEGFLWAVEEGTLLDDNERSVSWIAPTEIQGTSKLIKVEVCVRKNHLYLCQSDKVLVTDDQVNTKKNSIGYKFKQETKLGQFCPSQTHDIVLAMGGLEVFNAPEYLQSTDPVVPPLISTLECCSTKPIWDQRECRRDC